MTLAAFEDLLRHFEAQVRTPWRADVPPAGRVWILWYEKALERRVRGRLHEIEEATRAAGHGWTHLDLAPLFPRWLAQHDLFADLLTMPDELRGLLPDLAQAVTAEVRTALHRCARDDLMTLSGCGALFGFMRISALIGSVEAEIPGRLLLLFPGHYAKGIYRLLDAREGWNYHAVPIPAAELS
jgi:hypothetical protein